MFCPGGSSLELLHRTVCLLTLAAGVFGQDKGVVKVKEGSDVVLSCSHDNKENIVSKLFDWRKDGQKEVFLYDAGLHYNNGLTGQDQQFKGRVSHFAEQLKYGNASITIRNTTMKDSGNYTCDFPRLKPRQTFHIKLVVGAAPKPSIRILHATEDRALLQCEVHGASLKPKVEWRGSAGNILSAEEPQITERGGSYDITLNITVTKTDRYRCVVTQEEIGHQTQDETFVFISEKRCEDWIGWLGGWFTGVMTLAGVLALLMTTKCITMSLNKGSCRQRNISYEQGKISCEKNGFYEPPSEQLKSPPV